MGETGLLIIDMQAGNFSGPNPIFNGVELLAKVKRLVEKAHSVHVPIVYVQNDDGGNGDPGEYGTPGLEIHSSIRSDTSDILVRKKTLTRFIKRTYKVS